MTTIAIAEKESADIQVPRPNKQPNQAVSLSLPFAAVQAILESAPRPRRPNRNRPVHTVEGDSILAAWEAASDEAWGLIED
jgi:hypothetical protein